MKKFQVKKAYLKGEKGWRVIKPGKDGLFWTLEKGLTRESATELVKSLNKRWNSWKFLYKEKEYG